MSCYSPFQAPLFKARCLNWLFHGCWATTYMFASCGQCLESKSTYLPTGFFLGCFPSVNQVFLSPSQSKALRAGSNSGSTGSTQVQSGTVSMSVTWLKPIGDLVLFMKLRSSRRFFSREIPCWFQRELITTGNVSLSGALSKWRRVCPWRCTQLVRYGCMQGCMPTVYGYNRERGRRNSEIRVTESMPPFQLRQGTTWVTIETGVNEG